MYELIHVKGNTYYIQGPTNCGVYVLNQNNDVALIDCGTSDDAPYIYEALVNAHFNLTHLIFTHSHADHTGGWQYLYEKTGCEMIASKIERAFLRDSKLDIGFLYGGYPLDEYDNKLMHIDDNNEIKALNHIPKGLQSFKLPGHHYGMIGIKTDDDVFFVADSLGSSDLVSKNILLIYDVKGYLSSLDFVSTLDGYAVIPSHAPLSYKISDLVAINKRKIEEIVRLLLEYLKEEHNCVECTQYIFNHYGIKATYNKYMLVLSTIRSYLSYLSNNKNIKTLFKDNRIMFIKI